MMGACRITLSFVSVSFPAKYTTTDERVNPVTFRTRCEKQYIFRLETGAGVFYDAQTTVLIGVPFVQLQTDF